MGERACLCAEDQIMGVLRRLASILVIAATIAASPAMAHVLPECSQLYIDAGKESGLSIDGPDMVTRARRSRMQDEYLKLSGQVLDCSAGR